MEHKISWGVMSAANVGHVEGFDGFLEKLKYDDGRWAFMVSTPERTYRHVSESYQTKKEMEQAAIRYLINKGEIA